jgi:GNAT superfamily N-acetyltransferase
VVQIVIPDGRPKYEIALDDGSVVTLSPVIKTDRDFFRQGLESLSVESRFARFGQGVSSLSEAELDYLTDVDQRHHVAWGAAIDDEVAGVGRYIVPEEGGCPEVAITVLDELQRKGIGSLLWTALAAVARADGIGELCFEASADNVGVRRLVSLAEVNPLVSDGLMERRIRVSDLPISRHEPALIEVMDELRT